MQNTRSYQSISFILYSLAVISFIFSFYYGLDRILDDSYITYRYAENFANGFGFRWNIGEAPTEGFTSYLHVFILAIAHKFFSIDPLLTTRVMSFAAIFSVLYINFLIIMKSLDVHEYNISLPILLILILGNPLLVYISLFGLETLLITLIYTLTIYYYIEWYKTREIRAVIFLSLLSILAYSSRPDSIAFYGILYSLTFLSMYIKNYRFPKLHFFILFSALVIPVILLTSFRLYYFDSYFPNPYYIKHASKLIDKNGLLYVIKFIIWSSGFIFILFLQRKKLPSELRILLFTFFIFVSIFVMFKPLMGTAFRFFMPLWPIISLALIYCLQDKTSYTKKVIQFVFIPFSVIWLIAGNAHVYTATQQNKNTKFYTLIGKELSTFGSAYSIATGDQGALPYFSSWVSYDLVGLTDTYAAKAESGQDIAKYIFNKKPNIILLRKSKSNNYFIAHSKYNDTGNLLYNLLKHTYSTCCSFYDEDNNKVVLFISKDTEKVKQITEKLRSVLINK